MKFLNGESTARTAVLGGAAMLIERCAFGLRTAAGAGLAVVAAGDCAAAVRAFAASAAFCAGTLLVAGVGVLPDLALVPAILASVFPDAALRGTDFPAFS